MRRCDYPSHIFQPRHLTPEEEAQPGLVYHRLFDRAHLPTLREHLWIWLRMTVTGGFSSDQFDQQDREQLMFLYEDVARLLEAAHIEYSVRREELLQLDRQLRQHSFDQT